MLAHRELWKLVTIFDEICPTQFDAQIIININQRFSQLTDKSYIKVCKDLSYFVSTKPTKKSYNCSDHKNHETVTYVNEEYAIVISVSYLDIKPIGYRLHRCSVILQLINVYIFF